MTVSMICCQKDDVSGTPTGIPSVRASHREPGWTPELLGCSQDSSRHSLWSVPASIPARHPRGFPYSVFPGNNHENAEGVDHNHHNHHRNIRSDPLCSGWKGGLLHECECEGQSEPPHWRKKAFVPVVDDKKPDDGPAATISLQPLPWNRIMKRKKLALWTGGSSLTLSPPLPDPAPPLATVAQSSPIVHRWSNDLSILHAEFNPTIYFIELLYDQTGYKQGDAVAPYMIYESCSQSVRKG